MEIMLTRQAETQIDVHCNSQYSHTFALPSLLLEEEPLKARLLHDPMGYGQLLYAALFPSGTLALKHLEQGPEPIVLVTSGDDLDAIPWEYLCGPDGFLVRERHFSRGLPTGQRIPAPILNTSLHIVAIPSDPLSSHVPPLNTHAEWMNLKESVTPLPFALTLERTRPSTLKQLRNAVANQQHRVVHFMGHGAQDKGGAVLYFEKEDGELDIVEAREFALRIRGTTFLVTFNACTSATPGTTAFSNLAASLVRQKIPYALGMRLSIYDDDARLFARAFYDDMARGSSVEEALLQARLTLARESHHPWAVGVPVLYTSLTAPATGFVPITGAPIIDEHQPHMEMSDLPRAEGTFQGRVEDLKYVGRSLTGDRRSGILTVHGGGGIGKTTLAREAAERFAFAWPGGVWSTSLENLPKRARLAVDLARFLAINVKEISDPAEVECRIFAKLSSQRTLLVLDNVETLVEAIEADDAAAIDLGQFLQQLPGSSTSLLITSRVPLGWVNEDLYELGGLFPAEGAKLFTQCAPGRKDEIDAALTWNLSEKVEGHPLSLRLLGSAFNVSTSSLNAFIEEYETQAMSAQNKYRHLDHRHRSLYACIDTSVRYLNADMRTLLSTLSIFHAPFLLEAAKALLGPGAGESENTSTSISEQLHQLWQRSLLAQKAFTNRGETFYFYHVLPTTRLYIEQYLPAAAPQEELHTKFASVQANIARLAQEWLHQTPFAITLAQQSGPDIERGIASLTGRVQARYKFIWGAVLHRLGAIQPCLALLEEALEAAEGQDLELTHKILINMGGIYREIGQPQRAMRVYEQILPVLREIGNRSEEAATLNQMAQAADLVGQRERALNFYEQALAIVRETNDRSYEPTILNNMGELHRHLEQPKQALNYFQQSLPLLRELNDRDREASTLNNAAIAFLAINQPEQALKLSEQALPILRELGNRNAEALVLQTIGHIYSSQGEREQALNFSEQALAILREVSNRSGEAMTLNNIASLYQNDGQSRRALDMFQEALSIQREIGDRASEAVALGNIAAIYQEMGERMLALDCFEQALPLMRATGKRSGEAAVLMGMVRCYQDEQPEHALSLLEQALALLLRQEDDISGVANVYAMMADIYQRRGEREQELHAYEHMLLAKHTVGNGEGAAPVFRTFKQDREQSQEGASLYESILREIEEVSGETDILLLMGTLCRELGRLERAIRLFKQARYTLHERGDYGKEGAILNHIGEMYQELEQPEQAVPFFEQALSIVREQYNRDGEISVLYNLAGAHRALGQVEQALALYTSVLSITREVKNRESEAAALNHMGSIYGDRGQLQQALETYEQALLIEREVENRIGESTVLNGMGDIYRALEQPEQALRLYEQALAIVREQNSRAGEIVALHNMAQTQEAMGELQQAFHLYEQIPPILHEMGNSIKEATVLQEIGKLLYLMGQPQQALSYFEQALSLRREIGYREGEASALHNIGEMYAALDQPGPALSYFTQALSILHEIGSRGEEANTLNDMGRIYRTHGQLEQALKLYEQALPLKREVKDRVGEAVILANAGEMCRVIGQPERALELYKQAHDIEYEVGNRNREASLLPVIGYIYQVMGQAEQALNYYEQSLPLLREVNERSRELSTLNAMGGLYMERGQFEQALSSFERLSHLLCEDGKPDEGADMLFALGKMCRSNRKLEQALHLFDQALAIQREVGNRHREAVTLQTIGDVYRENEQPAQALNYYEQALPILRETKDIENEVSTLTTIVSLYQAAGQPEKTLPFLERLLSIMHELGADTSAEAASILDTMGDICMTIGQPERALNLLEQALSIHRNMANYAGETMTLSKIALCLYIQLSRPQEAIAAMEHAVELLEKVDASPESMASTKEQFRYVLDVMQRGESFGSPKMASGVSAETLEVCVQRTIEVMTTAPESLDDWQAALQNALQKAQQNGPDQFAVDLFTALLALLKQERPALPPDHPYIAAIQAIYDGVAQVQAQMKEKTGNPD